MPADNDDRVTQVAASVRCGSIVAAAGCGKTEEIARATALSQGRRLILTHTNAGVDALRERLRKNSVPDQKYRIDTIAGWSLRFAGSFPTRSGLDLATPRNHQWNKVYECAAALVRTGAVSGVLPASYEGLFVDEYQDCTFQQHEVICALAAHLPTCVFGDPLQAIFDFSGQKPVDWDANVFPQFAKAGELGTPWRWKNVGNEALAGWLSDARRLLGSGKAVDLNGRPPCVTWGQLPAAGKPRKLVAQRQGVILHACRSVTLREDESLVVIGDGANLRSRADLAQRLARFQFTNIEPRGCEDLFKRAALIETSTGLPRMEATLDFAAACMTGTKRSELMKAVQSRLAGGRQGGAKFGKLLPLCVDIVTYSSYPPLVDFFEAIRTQQGTHLYRREMFTAMCSALRLMTTGKYESLQDAAWEIQNRVRHAGRKLGRRSIGSTLLVKGLQFDHAVIIDADSLSAKNLYVALTRPTRTLTILSRSLQIGPQA